jgi:hypothetical protein
LLGRVVVPLADSQPWVTVAAAGYSDL